MRLPLKKIDKQIEKLSLDTVMLDAGDIPQLGEAVKSLESIEALVKNGKKSPLAILTLAMRQYVEGVIMTVLGGVTQVGRNDVVVINRGLNHGIDVGHVLAIAKQGAVVRDGGFRGDMVQLPTERAGVLLVFQSFEKMAYGLVLQTSEPLRIMDVVRTP